MNAIELNSDDILDILNDYISDHFQDGIYAGIQYACKYMKENPESKLDPTTIHHSLLCLESCPQMRPNPLYDGIIVHIKKYLDLAIQRKNTIKKGEQ
jgi:hypothetical protein